MEATRKDIEKTISIHAPRGGSDPYWSEYLERNS